MMRLYRLKKNRWNEDKGKRNKGREEMGIVGKDGGGQVKKENSIAGVKSEKYTKVIGR